jgi:hypothetical protein
VGRGGWGERGPDRAAAGGRGRGAATAQPPPAARRPPAAPALSPAPQAPPRAGLTAAVAEAHARRRVGHRGVAAERADAAARERGKRHVGAIRKVPHAAGLERRPERRRRRRRRRRAGLGREGRREQARDRAARRLHGRVLVKVAARGRVALQHRSARVARAARRGAARREVQGGGAHERRRGGRGPQRRGGGAGGARQRRRARERRAGQHPRRGPARARPPRCRGAAGVHDRPDAGDGAPRGAGRGRWGGLSDSNPCEPAQRGGSWRRGERRASRKPPLKRESGGPGAGGGVCGSSRVGRRTAGVGSAGPAGGPRRPAPPPRDAGGRARAIGALRAAAAARRGRAPARVPKGGCPRPPPSGRGEHQQEPGATQRDRASSQPRPRHRKAKPVSRRALGWGARWGRPIKTGRGGVGVGRGPWGSPAGAPAAEKRERQGREGGAEGGAGGRAPGRRAPAPAGGAGRCATGADTGLRAAPPGAPAAAAPRQAKRHAHAGAPTHATPPTRHRDAHNDPPFPPPRPAPLARDASARCSHSDRPALRPAFASSVQAGRRGRASEPGPGSSSTPQLATMGIWLSRMLSYFGDREARILVLGLDNAGKTTILCEWRERRAPLLARRCSRAAAAAARTPPLPAPRCSCRRAQLTAPPSSRCRPRPARADRLQVGEVVSTIPSAAALGGGWGRVGEGGGAPGAAGQRMRRPAARRRRSRGRRARGPLDAAAAPRAHLSLTPAPRPPQPSALMSRR